jgi:hypothetical protein
MIGFGFLLVLFVAGLGISVVKLAGSFRAGGAKGASHATH